jgi:hypothetical protein
VPQCDEGKHKVLQPIGGRYSVEIFDFFLSDDISLIILFLETKFFLTYNEINEPMILRVIILSKKLTFSFADR